MKKNDLRPEGSVLDNDTMIPVMALVVYCNKGPISNNYVEVAKFECSEKGHELMPGRPLGKKDAQKISETLSRGSEDFLRPANGCFIPKNILSYWGTETEPTIVWYVKPHCRRAWFSKSTGIKGKSLPYPCLVFKVSEGDLSVFVCPDDEIKVESSLYPLPLPNIYENCEVCLGDAEILTSPNIHEVVKNYEQAFFETEYNVFHGVEEMFGSVNLVNYWNKCIANGKFELSIYDKLNRKNITTVKNIMTN